MTRSRGGKISRRSHKHARFGTGNLVVPQKRRPGTTAPLHTKAKEDYASNTTLAFPVIPLEIGSSRSTTWLLHLGNESGNVLENFIASRLDGRLVRQVEQKVFGTFSICARFIEHSGTVETARPNANR